MSEYRKISKDELNNILAQHSRWLFSECKEGEPANLSETDLSHANFFRKNLFGANLSGAYLRWVNLRDANFEGVNLRGADLCRTIFGATDLDGADLTNAKIGLTFFGDVDLSKVKGLETVRHIGPSTIGVDTLERSGDNISDAFLRGAGLSDQFVSSTIGVFGNVIQFYSCFISYSHKDEEFAKRLHADLQRNGVRCWFAPEDFKIGDEMRSTIYTQIRKRDKLLLVLSEESINSAWVQNEVEKGFEEEIQRDTTMLFPIRLDSTVMETDKAWAGDIRRQRNIGDFTNWKDHDFYQKSFQRLLKDLKVDANAE